MPRYTIRYGFPKIHNLMSDLKDQLAKGTISTDNRKLLKKYVKCFKLLSEDPYYTGLNSHEIKVLTSRYKQKVFESYLENHTPSAGRVFWVYGPNKAEIIICGIEPHPKKSAIGRVKLELTPKERDVPKTANKEKTYEDYRDRLSEQIYDLWPESVEIPGIVESIIPFAFSGDKRALSKMLKSFATGQNVSPPSVGFDKIAEKFIEVMCS